MERVPVETAEAPPSPTPIPEATPSPSPDAQEIARPAEPQIPTEIEPHAPEMDTAQPFPRAPQDRAAWSLLSTLDADGNGLYDDKERKLLLTALQREVPELRGEFDRDKDGAVTPLEQTEGRHPLSMIIPRKIALSRNKIPWGIDIFPEWISTAYLQEDVIPSRTAQHMARGNILRHAVQENPSLQPTGLEDAGGIEFSENSGKHFMIEGYRDACWDYRWCIFTFRIDARSGSDEETILLDLNRGEGSNKSSPKIWYNKQTGLSIQFVGENVGGLDRRIMNTRAVIADGKTWNTVVTGIRYGQMYAQVNGRILSTETPQPERFGGNWVQSATSYIGDSSTGNMAWAYDALIFGLTEPSEAMVDKMSGWAAHRLGVQENLPTDHPYRNARPVLDTEDLPYRYVHNDDVWTKWGESLKGPEVRRHAGRRPVEPQGFERVFFDDFRADRVKRSTSGEGDLWVGPGFNRAVGGDAKLIAPGEEPNAYRHDAEAKKQYISLVPQDGAWRGSAVYTVNDHGYGYTWRGPKVFRIRCMFPKRSQSEIAGGLFPAFWSYDPDFLFWRTANRIEVDYFEFDGQNVHYLNSFSSHVHYVHLKNIFVKNPDRYKSYKVYGRELTKQRAGVPDDISIWDGEFHTWEFVIDDRMTYINVSTTTRSGQERWIEVGRAPTSPIYLERLDLQICYALKGNHGAPKEREDLVVDWVEVFQQTRQLEVVPDGFAARPVLSGSTTAGSVVTCEPNVNPGITDIRYYWFADEYPLTYGTSNTYTLTEAEAGKTIRCMVMAAGALDRPEAWSNKLR